MQVYGEKELTVEDPGEVITDRFGLETASVTWKKELPDNQRGVFYRGDIPKVGDSHPYVSHLKLVRRKIKWTPGIVLMPCDYEGVESETEPVYSLEAGLSEDPIESHKRFLSFAGTPSIPINGAIFDSDGKFVGWPGVKPFGSTTVTNYPWGGVTGFLDFSKAVWTRTNYTNKNPNAALATLGRIHKPPGGAPTYTNRNYLYMGVNSEQRGGAYQVKHQWLLSGEGGWIPAIYGYGDNVV